ncbi:uncharacterized protein [Mobula birostris]|uniref:uncharacterized protein isoform X5 n=1 Tax=Mobula birostris TaxID=1983395 RepID=UPI003B2814EA
MIDLSHLTEEEQAKILRVLQRDAELRKVEETRIRQLQVNNEIQRKNMTGEWFYKAKARRHKDTLHGAELIAASMRRKKPKTIYERLQTREAKENSTNFSKNATGDIFIPPELSLLLEEPKNSATSHKENSTQRQQQMTKKNPPSLGKQRENPFNKSFSSTDYPNEQERPPLSIGNQSALVTSMQESLSHPKDNVSRLHFPTNEHSPAENNSEMRPVPKPRTISSKLQVPSDNLSDASGSKNWNGLYNNSSTPKSILKRSPSSSSNDSEILRIGVQDSRNKVPASQTIPEGTTVSNEAMANEESLASNNLEKLKHVRFSTNVDEKRISQTQEHYDANELSKIGEDSFLDTDYMEEMNEEDTAGMDFMEENETLPEDSGFSDLRHLPLELQTDLMQLNQEFNSMSNTDFQSIQATDSNPENYSDSYLPHSSSSKLTNQIHELDTGEMLMEKKSSRRSNSPSNPSHYSIDEQIPHTDFASSRVSDQQPPEIFQGKRVNFAVPPTKTASTEQRLKAHYSKSHMPEKYTSEHTKATDESISKVLDWFNRSEVTPSVTLEEEKSPSETMVVDNLKPLKTVLPEPDAEFTHNESTLFTEEPQLLPNVNLETEKEENDIQLQKVQTPIKKNIFDKSAIQESMLLEEKSQTGTKVVPDITYPVSPILNYHSNDKQQFLNHRQNKESEQEPLTLKPFTEERGFVTKEITGEESENTESTSEDIDILPVATIENTPQQSKSSLEKTKFATEESKTLATIGNKDEKDIPSTVEVSSPKDKTSYQKNAFASAVFGRSSKKEDVIDTCSIDYRLAALENEGNNPIETKPSTFLSNEVVHELDQNKTKEERTNVELDQQNLSGNKKEQIAAIGEEKEIQRQKQVENKPVIGEVSAEDMAFSKIETMKPSSKQDKQYSNTSQWNRNVDVPDVEQASSKEENKTEMNLHLEANDTNTTPEGGGSRAIEENDISQEKLNNFDLPSSAIQSNLNTDVSFKEEISPIKCDEGPMYNEDSEINLDKNKEDFESQDEFGPRLNLPSGITRSSTFKESDNDSDEIPTKILRTKNPHDVEQEANNMFSSHSVENNQLNVQTRGSLSDDEITHVARRRNSQTKDTYKSLEDLNAIDSMPSTLDSKNKEIVLSADDVSNIPVSPENTPLQSKKLKRLSQSVPALAENGDADSMSERSYQMNKYGTITGSLTNISSSPGMTSRSSVSGSIMSIYSSDFGNIDVRGKIQFSLDYVDKLKEFHIFVVRCSDLAAADEKKNRSDPYVKSYLLPDKVKLGKKKTTVKKKTLSPVYNEILRYKVEKNILLAQTLNLSVWHNDTFGRNDFLGEVEIELEKWDWSNKQMEWYNLKPKTVTSYTSDNKGTLRVAFRYIPQGYKGKRTGEVQIWVKEATNLPQIRAHRLDPFVKCFILPDTSKKSRQKTRVVKKSRNPSFNHTMVYDGFGPEDLKDACVELSVWDHDKLVNHFLGGLRIGLGTGKSYGLAVDWMDSTEEEKLIWNKMITHPNVWVENVLPLRMLMLSKSTTN